VYKPVDILCQTRLTMQESYPPLNKPPPWGSYPMFLVHNYFSGIKAVDKGAPLSRRASDNDLNPGGTPGPVIDKTS